MNAPSSALRAPVQVGLAGNDADLEGILALQRANLKRTLSPAESAEQGFVTLVHTLDMLRDMHALAPSVVAKSGGAVVGYALTTVPEARHCVPALLPMFDEIERVTWRGAPLAGQRFYVLGQICVARPFRSTGLFAALYAEHDARYGERFDCFVTVISPANTRSLRAHAKVGFETVSRYAHDGNEWVLVARAMRPVAR
jgi:L-amino acid N-acyltransferase YncA